MNEDIKEIIEQCENEYNDLNVKELVRAGTEAFIDCFCKGCDKCSPKNNCMITMLIEGYVDFQGNFID